MNGVLHRLRQRNERGVIAIFTVMCMSGFMFGAAALGVDVSRWYLEAQRVQKAADAGALGAVSYMPQDLAGATVAARDISSRNGYPNSGTTSVGVEQGDKTTQLKVTVCSQIKNTFGAMVGISSTTICRFAVADYTGPQPMGSPCNTFGNEPPGTAGAGPATSQLQVPVGATCPQYPQFWASVAGPEVYKTQGDQYGTRYCDGGEDGCSSTASDATNTEFRPEGYFMLVRVTAAAIGQNVNLQIYDPAYVSTASQCTTGPTPSSTKTVGSTNYANTDNWNNYATTDARTRYANSAGTFCSGDNDNAGLRHNDSSDVPTVTSYGLRAPTDSANPLKGTPVNGCTRQYPGYGDFVNTNLISAATGSSFTAAQKYNDDLAKVFHQWKTLCTFTPTRAGDYYLQVRTNVPLQGAINDEGSYKPGVAANATMFTQTGDDTTVKGNGTNRFALRAYGTVSGSVSIASYGRMPIFANANTAAPIFNLIRVLPAAAGKSLVFTFFDVGDSAADGTMTVLPPTESTGSNITTGSNPKVTGCVGSGYKNQALPNCSIGGIRNTSGWDGKAETISVPIPTNYTCSSTLSGGCWYRVQVNFGAGSVTDATTWTAAVSGDPVRLIQ